MPFGDKLRNLKIIRVKYHFNQSQRQMIEYIIKANAVLK